MTPFPHSPTGTTGLQKAFAISIRKVFRDKMREIYDYLQKHDRVIKESLRTEAAIDKVSMVFILTALEGLKLDLSPVVKTFIGAAWMNANQNMAREMNLGDWIPFDRRVAKAVQDSSYKFLYRYIDEKQNDLKDILETGISQGDSISTIAKEVKDSFKTTSWKSELIARSETIRTYGKSTKMAIQNGGVTKEYKWLTSLKENVCPVCRPLHGKVFPIDGPNSPMPVTDTHPQCNCGLIPYIRI